jgi:hypothetical protein
MPVSKGSAAIIPRQFTGQPTVLRNIGRQVVGWTTSGQGFFGFTDAIDDDRLGPTAIQVQNMIMARDPGRLIIEIVGGRDELTDITMMVPATQYGCPMNTQQTGTIP